MKLKTNENSYRIINDNYIEGLYYKHRFDIVAEIKVAKTK